MTTRDDILSFLRDPAAFAATAADRDLWTEGLDGFANPSIARTGDRRLRAAQEAAWRGLADQRVGLVLGPPGTGKTHLLSWLITGFGAVRTAHQRRARTLVTAFTKNAVGNVLDAVARRQALHDPTAPDPIFYGASPNGGLAAGVQLLVQPLIAGYLKRLRAELNRIGLKAPMVLMTSGGGLTTLENACELPIRLVESGPAGGAILASHVGTASGERSLLSFDMGGTTAKICIIDNGEPLKSRSFEVARSKRFMRGSGMPIRIPVIEMVEIGAGGGSIARIDTLGRIQVGPESATSEPGPACYGRGGKNATVTDADLVLGKIDPAHFAGGSIALHARASRDAIASHVSAATGREIEMGAFGICEVVEENMANASRVHAIERGKDVRARTMIAFGGAAPLHAARLAEKLGIRRVIVPRSAGVGSAVGRVVLALKSGNFGSPDFFAKALARMRGIDE